MARHTKNFVNKGAGDNEPERLEEVHRPPAKSTAREAKSQKVQYKTMPHGTNKGVKVGINEKTGRREE